MPWHQKRFARTPSPAAARIDRRGACPTDHRCAGCRDVALWPLSRWMPPTRAELPSRCPSTLPSVALLEIGRKHRNNSPAAVWACRPKSRAGWRTTHRALRMRSSTRFRLSPCPPTPTPCTSPLDRTGRWCAGWPTHRLQLERKRSELAMVAAGLHRSCAASARLAQRTEPRRRRSTQNLGMLCLPDGWPRL